MSIYEVREDDVIELGSASIETHGTAPIGLDDHQTGLKVFPVGISSDD